MKSSSEFPEKRVKIEPIARRKRSAMRTGFSLALVSSSYQATACSPSTIQRSPP